MSNNKFFQKNSLDTKSKFFILVSEMAIEVCTKIYEKSRSVVSIATTKRRSIKFEKSHSTPSFSSEEHRHPKISNPEYPAMHSF